ETMTTHGGAGAAVGAVCEPSAPPAVVELLPLPEGIPEELPVLCCGRRAVLLLRTQRVQYDGAMMPVANFEKICGRGDAKKWKASLWLVDEDGNPVRQVGDMLAEKKVDRNILTRLMANAAQYEAYMEWQQQQQQHQHQQQEQEQERQGQAVREELMADDRTEDPAVSGGGGGGIGINGCDVADVITADLGASSEVGVEVRGDGAIWPSGGEQEGAAGVPSDAAAARDGVGRVASAAAVGKPPMKA
ncbi:hypothetical protein Vretifemale_1359, partial [Volvox reticuliferus]